MQESLRIPPVPFSSTEQKGPPGHCLVAQVFDANGHSIACIEPTDDPAEATAIAKLFADAPEMQKQLIKEGPLNSERWTLDELLAELAKWKSLASGRTCVSFESLCFGASSLWHQTHRENFRAVDRKPELLSRWVLESEGSVREDFPEQVLGILVRLSDKIKTDAEYIRKLEDSLCMAICIIQNDAGIASLAGLAQTHETRARWVKVLIAESGIDFNTVLGRVDEKGNEHGESAIV